uniref:Putative methyltransferase n=1 Tax=viral metagenome TaxID=1070528 RepID=A0A6M3L2E2_9ZZZZ
MTTDLVKIPKCNISKTGLQFTQDITFAEWKQIGAGLKEIEGCIQFWVGDWLNYGHDRYEHGKYEEALQELGYAKGTLENFSSIAKKVESSRRREHLSYRHHTEVASFEPEEQTLWLDKAETEHLPVRELRKQIKESRKPEIAPLPSDKYRVVYADSPWSYGDKLIEGYGTAEHHYQTMSIEELCSMNIIDIVEDDAVLFLWVTSPLLSECWEVIEAWGFKYKSSFVWDKVKHNYGHYNSVRHELLLICTRGSCLPETKELHDSVVILERSQKHSEKPEYFRELIDKMYPSGKRIELFARVKSDGWDGYGNEL